MTDKILEKIAADHFGTTTLETRNSDSLDFTEVSVWQLKKALRAAYDAGQERRDLTTRQVLITALDEDAIDEVVNHILDGADENYHLSTAVFTRGFK